MTLGLAVGLECSIEMMVHSLELEESLSQNAHGASHNDLHPVHGLGTIDAALRFMDKDQAMDEMTHKIKTGSGRRFVFLGLVVVALAVLIWVVVAGFRGRNISQDAKAMTPPAAEAVK